jgi:hypothetical protein
MKKGIVFAMVFLLAVGVMFAQEAGQPSESSVGESDETAPIDYAELEQNLSPVTFISYEGPYARIDTRAQIRGIGYELGTAIRAGASFAGDRNRYFILHSVTDPEFGRLNADVFGLGPDAGVDHIRNLRLIIQGYLEAAYGYSAGDAALIAEFSTVYNAVFRGNWHYFSTRYKTALVQYLVPAPDRAGLSIRFDEWPGQTMMMLPLLTATPASLSAVDTGAISGEEVIDEMRKDDDRGVEARQGLVDLKERESEQAAEAAAEQRRQIAEEEQRLAEQRRTAAAERERAAQEAARIAARIEQERAALADAAPEEKAAAEQKLQEEEDALAETNRQLDEQEETLAEQDRALDEQRDEAARNEAIADQRADEAQNERQAIAEDQAAIIAGGDRPAIGNVSQTGTVAIRLIGPSSALGIPVRIETVTGGELQRGTLNTVDVNTLVTIAGRIFAIAGANTANGVIRLIELDLRTLGMKVQGDVDIIENSPLWTFGMNLYALITVDGAPQIARFNLDLVQQAVTRNGVHPNANVIFAGNRLLIQGPDGGIMSLNPTTLVR